VATDSRTLQQKIAVVASNIKRREPDLLLLAGKRLEGLMKRRIFNEGKDQQGSQIGKYKSKRWEKIRSRKGRQTAFVDLQFTGDLIRSFKTVRSGDEVFLAIVNDRDFLKAKGNEERRKKIIFEPTNEEVQVVERYFEDLLTDAVEQEFLKL